MSHLTSAVNLCTLICNLVCYINAANFNTSGNRYQRINRIVIDVDFEYYCKIIHLPATPDLAAILPSILECHISEDSCISLVSITTILSLHPTSYLFVSNCFSQSSMAAKLSFVVVVQQLTHTVYTSSIAKSFILRPIFTTETGTYAGILHSRSDITTEPSGLAHCNPTSCPADVFLDLLPTCIDPPLLPFAKAVIDVCIMGLPLPPSGGDSRVGWAREVPWSGCQYWPPFCGWWICDSCSQ